MKMWSDGDLEAAIASNFSQVSSLAFGDGKNSWPNLRWAKHVNTM